MKVARDVRLLVAGALIVGSMACAIILGSHNWTPEASHNNSVFWLLFPVIATTTFVVFGAWRSANCVGNAEEIDEL